MNTTANTSARTQTEVRKSQTKRDTNLTKRRNRRNKGPKVVRLLMFVALLALVIGGYLGWFG